MKRRLLIWLGLAAALVVQAALPAVPNVGDARIVVLANNLQNFYYYYADSSRPDYNTDAGRAEKTRKIADMVIASGADIFAFCEVEAKPIILEFLVEAINGKLGSEAFDYVTDNIYEESDEYDNAIKSGFVYRKSTVEPYGDNYAAANAVYYRNTMRIQAWTELATGEHFTLSMNHFKAMSDEASQAKRVQNANWLINGLNTSYKVQDPDILIMGDLNAQMNEECISVLLNNNYTEQLLRFDANAYSYIYYSNHELIDHAFANETMMQQITGAAVWHTNTSVNSNQRYSDHDAVMVGLSLGDDPQGFTNTNADANATKILRDGQLIIIRSGAEFTITGQRLR